MSAKKTRYTFLIILFAVATSFVLQPVFSAAIAAEGQEEMKPDRSVTLAPEYPAVEIPSDKDEVSVDLIVDNKGRSDETVSVWISEIPKGWKARIKTYRYTVMGVYVESGKDKTLTFEAEPPHNVQPGDYTFKILGKTQDNRFNFARDITIKVMAKTEGDKTDKGVKLTTSYPVLRGPSDGKFEFSLDVDSKLDKDAVFDLIAQGPKDWDINFKPAYEDKFISSLRLKANASKTVAVAVKPPPQVKAGDYPIQVRVSSGEAKGEATLHVILTGTYGLEVGTPNGLLSLDARQGKTSNISFYVKNTGSAINNNIKFLSFKPENWKVDFKPETIPSIKPGDLKQVELSITPNSDALVGDYSVTVNVDGEKATKPIEFRTTVKASTAWGWIGIGIIVLVIVGLTGLFRGLGRR